MKLRSEFQHDVRRDRDFRSGTREQIAHQRLQLVEHSPTASKRWTESLERAEATDVKVRLRDER